MLSDMTAPSMHDSHEISQPVGIRRSTAYLPEVESLRGIAMLLVYVFHLNGHVAGQMTPAEAQLMSPWWAFVRAGHTGVSLFFVLSGFLLSLPFWTEAAGGKRVNRGRFYERRALRILPLYYTAVVVGTVMSATRLADLTHGLPYLAFLNAVGGWSVALWPYSSTWWSLATEAQYYIVLPLLPLFLGSPMARRIGVALLLAYATAYAALLAGDLWLATLEGNMALRWSLFGRGPLFLCGIAVGWMYQRAGPSMRERLRTMRWVERGGADLLVLVVIIALGVLLRWTLRQGYQAAEAMPNFAWHLLEGLLWATILALALLAPLRLKALVANRALGYLGILSYSMYLWHTAILYWVPKSLWMSGWRWTAGWNWPTAGIAALVTVASLAVSQLTYALIERPFLAHKARIE